MRPMKIRLFWIFALLAGIALAPAILAAPLQTADLNDAGDGLLTVDRSLDLEFLDPAVTAGQTYDEIAQSPFVNDQGFRFARTGELRQLLADGGITNFSGDFNTTDEAAVEKLLNNFIGQTITAPITLPPAGMRDVSDGVYGFTDDPDTPAGQFNVAGLDYQSAALDQAPQDQARTILNLISFPGDGQPPNPGGNGINGSIVGGFLVRRASTTAVPEPSGLGLAGLSLGMIGMGFWSRRRNRGEQRVSVR